MHFSDRTKQWLIEPLPTCPVWCRSLVSQSRFLTIKREKERDCIINGIWLTLNRPACSTDLISEKHVSGVLLAVSDICSQNHFPDKAINHSQYSSPMGTRGHQSANINPLSFTHALKVGGGDDIDGWQLRTMDAKKPRRKSRGLFTCKTPYVCS